LEQTVAEEASCVPQLGQNFIPAWAVMVGAVGIWSAGSVVILARLEFSL